MLDTTDSKRSSQLLLATGVAGTCLAILFATSPFLPLAWDEPNAILRAEKLEKWVTLWFVPDRAIGSPTDSRVIFEYCQYTTQIESHPALYGFVIAVSHLCTKTFLPGWLTYRCGPMLLFSIAAAACFHRLSTSYGRWPALFGFAALLTMPRLFGHVHYASIDGPLLSFWMLTWATFEWARKTRLWGPIVWGVLLGLTMSCKFTGWLCPVGFYAYALFQRDRNALRVCVIGSIAALITFYDFNPPLWNDTFQGIQHFLKVNLNRASHGLNIPAQFLGKRYDLNNPLPWYASILWIVFTVPPGLLAVALVGIKQSISDYRTTSTGLLLVFNCAVLVVVRSLPSTPPHDAERLFLPSFAFLALLAGVGCHSLIEAAKRISLANTKYWRFALIAVLASNVFETAWYAPQWLCYYSPVIRGIRGATSLGLEPAYYCDAVDNQVIDWLSTHTRRNGKVSCRISPEFDVLMARNTRRTFTFTLHHPDECDWYILQNRPSSFSDVDRLLVGNEKAVFQKTIRPPTWGIGPWQLDVPVLYIFSKEQFTAAVRHKKSQDDANKRIEAQD